MRRRIGRNGDGQTSEREIQMRLARIEQLIQAVDTNADENGRRQARELVEALLEMQGPGLERLMEIVYGPGPTGQLMIDELGRDELFRVCCWSTDFVPSISNRASAGALLVDVPVPIGDLSAGRRRRRCISPAR